MPDCICICVRCLFQLFVYLSFYFRSIFPFPCNTCIRVIPTGQICVYASCVPNIYYICRHKYVYTHKAVHPSWHICLPYSFMPPQTHTNTHNIRHAQLIERVYVRFFYTTPVYISSNGKVIPKVRFRVRDSSIKASVDKASRKRLDDVLHTYLIESLKRPGAWQTLDWDTNSVSDVTRVDTGTTVTTTTTPSSTTPVSPTSTPVYPGTLLHTHNSGITHVAVCDPGVRCMVIWCQTGYPLESTTSFIRHI
jgi:hypothetical protein